MNRHMQKTTSCFPSGKILTLQSNVFLKSSTKLKLGKFDSQKQATKTLIFTNNKCHYLSIGRCGGLVVKRRIRSEMSWGSILTRVALLYH